MCTVDEASRLCMLLEMELINKRCDPSNKTETCKPNVDRRMYQYINDVLGVPLQQAGSEDEQLQALILAAVPIRDALIALVRACGLA